MSKLIELSATVENALKHVARHTDDLFSDESKKILSRTRKLDKEVYLTRDCRTKYDTLVDSLPDGIYTKVSQILNIIDTTNERNSVNSVMYSPLALNYPEFKCCKILKYQKGHVITGRDQEIEQILLTLCKSTKRGTILVGEPGVGKTAIVNAINSRLVERTVPRQLIGAQILNLDIPYVFTRFKDDPIGAIIKVLERASSYDKAILFIDEVHQLLGHKMNDIMKPYLTEQIRFIGSTTVNEYHAIITEDVALERRFTVVPVEEPSVDKTIQMIQGTKATFEKTHKCIIPDDICKYVVENGTRFLGHRKNPDKSLDLLDIACAMLDNTEIKQNTVPYTLTGDFLTDLNKDKTELESINFIPGDRILNTHYVNQAISSVTNIPFDSIKNSLDYATVFNGLKEEIVGQEEALKTLANITNIFKHIKSGRNRPISVLLLVGPAGVGKRSAAKLLAKYLFGSSNRYIEFDMSGMTSEFMITELKGAPPGYVGYGKSGGLIKSIRNNSQSVVFFRGTDKADATIKQYLIECARHGRITDSADREASLVNTVLLHSITLNEDDTSKVFNIKSKSPMGFSPIKDDKDKKEKYNEKELKRIVGEELLRSADEVVLFNKLTEADLKKIFDANLPKYLNMYDVDIDRHILESNVLTDSKNGHDVVTRLTTEVPKMVFTKLKE